MDINNEDRDLPIPQTKKVFVYGTLKSDCCNNAVMQKLGAEFLYKTETKYGHFMFKSKRYFPFLQKAPLGEGKIIKGEIWEVPTSQMDELDWFEGVPELYTRSRILVKEPYLDQVFLAVCYIKSNRLTENQLKHKEFISEWIE